MCKKEIIKIGKKVVDSGLVGSFFGNISLKSGERILITKTGTMLDELCEDSIVIVDLFKEDELDRLASSEIIVHRSIYQKTDALAVIHTHSIYSVLMASWYDDYLVLHFGEIPYFMVKVPIVTGKSGSRELADSVTNALKTNYLVIVKDHGVFAKGKTLKDCFIYLSALEHYAKYNFYRKFYENLR
ncbi:MAG: class II aldolase/adducin family protein [Calditerrivibrio sp.]|nr:class II aldolase/adducin family protein [Calditerrivibrio sp.]